MVASTETSAPTVVITGINGSQGGSVARALLASPEPYRLVGLTRDDTSDAAKAWLEKGVTIKKVAIGVGNKKEVFEAFKGADYVFAVSVETPVDAENVHVEIDNGKLMVDAALAANVKLFVWSGLDSCSRLSDGKYTKVTPFDNKEVVTEYLKASGVPWSIVKPGCYAGVIIGAGPFAPKKQEDGTYLLRAPCPPETPLWILHTPVDYGLYVQAAIENSKLGAGSEVLTGYRSTFAELCAALGKAAGKSVRYEVVPEDLWKQGGVFAVLMYEAFNCNYEFGFYDVPDEAIVENQKLSGVKVRTLDEILAAWDGPVLV
ncbi:hypothetical protein MNV49_005347 [Pseudohyphozyma bogoriensis]|nr:hypothetical protein MNV49_005347 [Pseudohyphozyma bogoriensis]